MGTETYPKSGKRGQPKRAQKPGNMGRQVVDEETGDVYRYRHSMGGTETRMREIYENDYGKKPAPTPERNGIPVSPRRTIITAS